MKLALILVVFALTVQSLEIKASVTSKRINHKHANHKAKANTNVHKNKFGKTKTQTHKIVKASSKHQHKVKQQHKKVVKPQHKVVRPQLMRFKTKAKSDDEGDNKLHISDAPKAAVLVGSEAQVGTTTELAAESTAESTQTPRYASVPQTQTFTESSYGMGLAGQSQNSAVTDTEQTNLVIQNSQTTSQEIVRSTEAGAQIRTDFTREIESSSQSIAAAQRDINEAISKEQNARKASDDTRAKSENDATQNLDDQLATLNDLVSQCSQNVQKSVEFTNMLESIVAAYSDKAAKPIKVDFLEVSEHAHLHVSEHAHVNTMYRLHAQFEKIQAKRGF